MPLAKLGYRTIVDHKTANDSFLGDTFDFSFYGPRGKETLRYFVPHVVVAWNMNDGRTGVNDLLIEFRDPDDQDSRVRVVDEQTVAAMTSAVFPGGGLGFPVPMRDEAFRLYDLEVTSSASLTVGQTLTVQLWWEPRWEAIAELFCKHGPEAVARQLSQFGALGHATDQAGRGGSGQAGDWTGGR